MTNPLVSFLFNITKLSFNHPITVCKYTEDKFRFVCGFKEANIYQIH